MQHSFFCMCWWMFQLYSPALALMSILLVGAVTYAALKIAYCVTLIHHINSTSHAGTIAKRFLNRENLGQVAVFVNSSFSSFILCLYSENSKYIKLRFSCSLINAGWCSLDLHLLFWIFAILMAMFLNN